MISLTKRFLYVHVPKTAGNATQTALVEFAEDQLFANPRQDGIQRFSLQNQYGTHKHSSLSEYLTALGPALFWNLTRFATVRNPWERAVSFYFSPHRNTTTGATWDRSAFVRTLYDSNQCRGSCAWPRAKGYLRANKQLMSCSGMSRSTWIFRFSAGNWGSRSNRCPSGTSANIIRTRITMTLSSSLS